MSPLPTNGADSGRRVGTRPAGVPVSLVTGAARGIGHAIAQRLVADGHRVFLLDIQDGVAEAARAIGGAGHHQLDVTDTAALQAAIDEVARDAGRLDTLVNCAGTCGRETFEQLTEDTWHRDLDTNVKATAFACQAAVFPHMKAQSFGRIVNIASVSGKLGGVGPVNLEGSTARSGAAYAAAKAGTINLTRWIARQVGGWGITANVVAPGPIATPMASGTAYDISDLPLARSGEAGDVAAAVAFLASDEAAFVTGDCMHVDGGLVRA